MGNLYLRFPSGEQPYSPSELQNILTQPYNTKDVINPPANKSIPFKLTPKDTRERNPATLSELITEHLNANIPKLVIPQQSAVNESVQNGQLPSPDQVDQFIKTGSEPILTTPRLPTPSGLIEKYIDLAGQPSVDNPQTGGKSTVWSMSIGTDKGETLISRVTPDGKILSPQEAIDYYKQTGRNLGTFKSVDEANAYAEQLHDDYANHAIPYKGNTTNENAALNARD